MQIRSIEELEALLTAQKGIALDVNGDGINVTLSVNVRDEEVYELVGDKENLTYVAFYNPNNTADDFVLDSFKDFDKFENVEKLYLIVLENYFDNSIEDMRSEAGKYYSNRDY